MPGRYVSGQLLEDSAGNGVSCYSTFILRSCDDNLRGGLSLWWAPSFEFMSFYLCVCTSCEVITQLHMPSVDFERMSMHIGMILLISVYCLREVE